MGFGSIAKVIALVIAAIAVAVGTIGKFAPALFLKIDQGFVLWAITGNPMPPYFDVSCWEDNESWLRDGDLVSPTACYKHMNYTRLS